MFDITTIGDCTVDTFIIIDHDEAVLQCDLKKDQCQLCLNFADKIPIKQSSQAIGGNAANVAVGCQKLNIKTAVVSELGNDLNSLTIRQALKAAKVNTKLVKVTKNRETRYAIILNYQGERTVLSYFGKYKYSLVKLPETKWLYYTSLGFSFEKIQDQLVSYLKKYPKINLAMNPGSYQLKKNLKKITELLPRTNLLFVNQEEAIKIVGAQKNITDLMKSLHQTGVKIAVVTNGSKGSYASNGQNIYFMPPYPITAISKAGAGDAFASGFMAAIINNKNIDEALTWGTADATGVIQKIGAEEGLMNKVQIIKTIKKYSKIKPQLI